MRVTTTPPKSRSGRWILIGLLTAAAAAFVFLGVACPKKPAPKSPGPKTQTPEKKLKPLGPPDDVVLCLLNQANMIEFDRQWPLPYAWHAMALNNFHRAGVAVVALDFDMSSHEPDPRGGVRIENVINFAAAAASPTFTVLRTPGPDAQNVWPPLTEPSDKLAAHWGTAYSRLFEQEEDNTVRLSALLGADLAPEKGLAMEAVAAALALGLDPEKMFSIWEKRISGGGRDLDLPMGEYQVPVEEYGGRYSFQLRPYGPAGAFPSITYRDALLMDLDPAPLVENIPKGQDTPPNADDYLWLSELQTNAFPPRNLGGLKLSGIIPTSAAVRYKNGRPSHLLVAGIKQGDKTAGAGVVFSLDNKPDQALQGEPVKLDFIPLGMVMDRRNDRLLVLDAKKKAIITASPKTLKQKDEYKFKKEEDQLLAKVDPFVSETAKIPMFQVQMLNSPAADTTYVLVPYTNSIVAFNPSASPAIKLHNLPDEAKGLHIDLTRDFERIYVYTNIGKMYTADTSNMKFSQLLTGQEEDEDKKDDKKDADKKDASKEDAKKDSGGKYTDEKFAWADPSVFRFRAITPPTVKDDDEGAEQKKESKSAPSVPDYTTVFFINEKTKNILGVDPAHKSRTRILRTSGVLIGEEDEEQEKAVIKPIKLIRLQGDRRLFALLRVESKGATGGPAPYGLALIEPYSRNWLTAYVPLKLDAQPAPLTADRMFVFLAPAENGIRGIVVDAGSAMEAFRAEMFAALRGKTVLIEREPMEETAAHNLAEHQDLGPIPNLEISATAMQNLINGDFINFITN